MTLVEFFSKDYLLDPNPILEKRMYLPLIIFFGALILLSILAKLTAAKKSKLSKKYFYCFLTTGILGFLYLFGSYEELPGLRSRVLFLSIFIILVIWVLYNSIWAIRYIPKSKKNSEIEERYRKYLPENRKK